MRLQFYTTFNAACVFKSISTYDSNTYTLSSSTISHQCWNQSLMTRRVKRNIPHSIKHQDACTHPKPRTQGLSMNEIHQRLHVHHSSCLNPSYVLSANVTTCLNLVSFDLILPYFYFDFLESFGAGMVRVFSSGLIGEFVLENYSFSPSTKDPNGHLPMLASIWKSRTAFF